MPPLTLNGTTGVSAVQAGAVESGDLPAGSVIQVVESASTTSISINAATTIISASITPQSTSNKVFAIYNGALRINASYRARANLQLLRNSTVLVNYPETFHIDELAGPGPESTQLTPMMILDSPSTTSSITYSIEISPQDGSPSIGNFGDRYSIVLMEIAG